jgi:hypothetical protein
VTCTFRADGVVLTQAFVIGPGDSVITALYWIAKAIDDNIPGVHAFSSEYMLGVQAAAGHDVTLLSLATGPFQEVPGPAKAYPYPVRASLDQTLLVFDVFVDGAVKLFTTPATDSPADDLIALAGEINLHPWLLAGLQPDRFVVALRPQRNLMLGTVRYG